MKKKKHMVHDSALLSDAQLGQIQRVIDASTEKFALIVGRAFEHVDQRFDRLERIMDGFEQRMNGFDQRLNGVNNRLDNFLISHDMLSDGHKALAGRVDKLETKVFKKRVE